LIQPVDGVLVEYEGRLADGTVFDDSARHGGPQPMIAGQVIPGFAEALSKMQKGGKYKIHIPGSQAYGANPPPGSPFGPNADLDFDVHIVEIVPNAALMGAGGGAPSSQSQQAPSSEPQQPSGQAPQSTPQP
jgi:FKBP-type peptidyl-prolyl cis-trans isomerase FkpA